MKVYLQKQKEVFEVILEQEERKAAAAKAEKAKASTAKGCRTGTVAVAAKESDVSGSWFPFFGGSSDRSAPSSRRQLHHVDNESKKDIFTPKNVQTMCKVEK